MWLLGVEGEKVGGGGVRKAGKRHVMRGGCVIRSCGVIGQRIRGQGYISLVNVVNGPAQNMYHRRAGRPIIDLLFHHSSLITRRRPRKKKIDKSESGPIRNSRQGQKKNHP